MLVIFLWALIVFTVNTFLGCVVFASTDYEDQRMLAWFKSCPPSDKWWAQPLILNAWPIWLGFRIYESLRR